MKSLILPTCLLITSFSATAGDKIFTYLVEKDLPHYEKSKFYSAGVDLYFSDATTPEVMEVLDTQSFARRSMIPIRKDRDDTDKILSAKQHSLCKYVFSSTLQRMKQHAATVGADAIINIKSNYGDIEHDDDKEYQCIKGYLLTAVALKGDYVKLK